MLHDSAPGIARRPLSFRLLVAALITGAVGLVAWLFLEILLVASVWPAVESPPRQGEAVLASSLNTPDPVHDPAALANAVREPVNTWSCLAFVLVAALVVQSARDALARWLALTIAAAGLCAMLYHASATREFRNLDIAGLYAACGLLVTLAAVRLRAPGTNTSPGLRGFVTWLVVSGLGVFAMLSRNVEVAGFKPLAVPVVTMAAAITVASMLLVYCLRRADPRKWQLGLGAIVLMALGVLFQSLDHPGGAWCVPGSLLQPHALWHVLCAISLGLAMECFESPTHAAA